MTVPLANTTDPRRHPPTSRARTAALGAACALLAGCGGGGGSSSGPAEGPSSSSSSLSVTALPATRAAVMEVATGRVEIGNDSPNDRSFRLSLQGEEASFTEGGGAVASLDIEAWSTGSVDWQALCLRPGAAEAEMRVQDAHDNRAVLIPFECDGFPASVSPEAYPEQQVGAEDVPRSAHGHFSVGNRVAPHEGDAGQPEAVTWLIEHASDGSPPPPALWVRSEWEACLEEDAAAPEDDERCTPMAWGETDEQPLGGRSHYTVVWDCPVSPDEEAWDGAVSVALGNGRFEWAGQDIEWSQSCVPPAAPEAELLTAASARFLETARGAVRIVNPSPLARTFTLNFDGVSEPTAPVEAPAPAFSASQPVEYAVDCERETLGPGGGAEAGMGVEARDGYGSDWMRLGVTCGEPPLSALPEAIDSAVSAYVGHDAVAAVPLWVSNGAAGEGARAAEIDMSLVRIDGSLHLAEDWNDDCLNAPDACPPASRVSVPPGSRETVFLALRCPNGAAGGRSGRVDFVAEDGASRSWLWRDSVSVNWTCQEPVAPIEVQEGLTANGRVLEWAEGVVRLSNHRRDQTATFNLSIGGNGILADEYPDNDLADGGSTLSDFEVSPRSSAHVHYRLPCEREGERTAPLQVNADGEAPVVRDIALTCRPAPVNATVGVFRHDYAHTLSNAGHAEVSLTATVDPRRAAVESVRWLLTPPGEGRMAFFLKGDWLNCLNERRRYANDAAEYALALTAGGDEEPEEPEPFDTSQCPTLTANAHESELQERTQIVAEWECIGRPSQSGALTIGVGNGGFSAEDARFPFSLSCAPDTAAFAAVSEVVWSQGRTVRRLNLGLHGDGNDDRTTTWRSEPSYIAPHAERTTHVTVAVSAATAATPWVGFRAYGSPGRHVPLGPLAAGVATTGGGVTETRTVYRLPDTGEWSGDLRIVLAADSPAQPILDARWGPGGAAGGSIRRDVIVDWANPRPTAVQDAFLDHVGDRVPLSARLQPVPDGAIPAVRGLATDALAAFVSRANAPGDWVIVADSGPDAAPTVGYGTSLNGSHARIAVVPAIPHGCARAGGGACTETQWAAQREAVEDWALAISRFLALPPPADAQQGVEGEWLDLLRVRPELAVHYGDGRALELGVRNGGRQNLPSVDAWNAMRRNATAAARPNRLPVREGSVAVVVPISRSGEVDADDIAAYATTNLPAWPAPSGARQWQLAFGREAGDCDAATAPVRAELSLEATRFTGVAGDTHASGLAWRVEGPVHRVYARRSGVQEWTCAAFDGGVPTP